MAGISSATGILISGQDFEGLGCRMLVPDGVSAGSHTYRLCIAFRKEAASINNLIVTFLFSLTHRELSSLIASTTMSTHLPGSQAFVAIKISCFADLMQSAYLDVLVSNKCSGSS